MKRNGAGIVLSILEKYGIEVVSGIPGGANLPLYDELSRSSIHHILARHEQGAGFIAQGYARASGRPGVAFVTSGPGATNIITALADAQLDSVPLVVISGQVVRSLQGRQAFQEVDTRGIVTPIIKGAYQAGSARELEDLMEHALRLSLDGRPGPVLVDIPRDVLTETVEISLQGELTPADDAVSPVAISPPEMNRALEWIDEAKRPVFFVGGGFRNSTAHLPLRRYLARHPIPVVSSLAGMGVVSGEDPLFLGMAGMHGSPVAARALHEADLVIALGTRFSDRTTGRVDAFAPEARVIHVDLDRSEHGKNHRADLPLHGDIASFTALLEKHASTPFFPGDRRDWLEILIREKASFPPGLEDDSSPTRFLRELSFRLPSRTRVVTDVGQHQMWTAQSWIFRQPGLFLTSSGLGTMGFGLPAALGAALVDTSPTVLITGDGSFLMNLQEMDTVIQERISLRVILLNNHRLGMVSQQQHLFFEDRLTESVFQTGPDFRQIAEGFGWEALHTSLFRGGERADSLSLDSALEEFLKPDRTGPLLLIVETDPDYLVSPTVPPGQANREPIHRLRMEMASVPVSVGNTEQE